MLTIPTIFRPKTLIFLFGLDLDGRTCGPHLSVTIYVHFFFSPMKVSVADFCTKLDSDELYCVTNKTATYCLSVSSIVHFSFSPMKIFVIDFSAPIGASVFKFCVHLQVV